MQTRNKVNTRQHNIQNIRRHGKSFRQQMTMLWPGRWHSRCKCRAFKPWHWVYQSNTLVLSLFPSWVNTTQKKLTMLWVWVRGKNRWSEFLVFVTRVRQALAHCGCGGRSPAHEHLRHEPFAWPLHRLPKPRENVRNLSVERQDSLWQWLALGNGTGSDRTLRCLFFLTVSTLWFFTTRGENHWLGKQLALQVTEQTA